MGLFDFIKKKNVETNIKNSMSFYTECVEDFHKEAMKNGVANRGLIFIPELIPRGEKAILAFLKDPFFQMQCGGNAQQYYYLIMALSIDAGMCFANRWHEQYSSLDQYVQEIIDDGPADEANRLIDAHFPYGIMGNQGNDFFPIIFERWIAMHEPYWNLADPRVYTFRAMLAAYQLGVSMILEKYGY